MPVHMATASWQWQPWDEVSHTAVKIPFEIHNDPGNFSDVHGLYLILAVSESQTRFSISVSRPMYRARAMRTRAGVSSTPVGMNGTCPMPAYPPMASRSPLDTRGTS